MESYLLITPITLANLSRQTQNQITAGRYQLLPVEGMPTSSLAWKRFLSEKSGRCGHCSRLRSAAYLWLIVVISVRQSTVAAISGLHRQALVMAVQRYWQPDCKIQRSGRNGQRDWCMSRVTAIIRLVICIIVRLSWAVNHYRDNAITYKAQRDKNARRELKLANAAITDMQMRQRDVVALDAKYTKSYWMLLKMMLCVMMLPLVVVGCTSKQSVSQCVKPPPPPAWIMQPPPTGRHRRTGLFHPQRECWSLCKNNWKEPRSILMSSADRVAHIDGQLMQLLQQYTRASSGV